jgi:hypothetical protein
MKHILLAAIAATSTTHAAISISLPGNSETSGWNNLANSNSYWSANGYPTSYPGATAWPAPVAANMAGSTGSAVLMKKSGNGYFSGSSLYDAGGAGTFSISDASPLDSLATIIFQIDAGTIIGVLPVLSYNGGSQALAPDYFTQVDGGYLTFNFTTGESFPTQNRAWQWDLTGLGVTSYEITWGSVANNHLTQYEFDLTTGDSFVQAIPEPASAVMISLVSLALFRRRRA